MSDDDKELVFALRKCWQDDPELKQAADRIEALSAENERLREALRDVLVYAPDFMHGMPKKHYEKIANGKL
jgi:hypothetical protein